MEFPFTLADDREFDVVGFGTNSVDFLIEVPNYPQFNSKIALSRYTRSPGGEIASTLVGLSRLGHSTAYVGKFGDDDAGKLGHASVVNEGVDTRFAEFVKDTPNQIAFIIIDEKSGERTVIWQRDDRLGYLVEDAPIKTAKLGRVLHLTPHDVEACVSMATAARNAGTLVSADIDKNVEGIEQLLPLVDVLISSADFPAKLTGKQDHREAVEAIRIKYGNALVGVTLGEAGSLVYCDGKFVETPGFETPGGCKDTTGAGDAFRAGLLHGILSSQTVERAAMNANAVAALKCRAIGARTSLPARAELDVFLAKSVSEL